MPIEAFAWVRGKSELLLYSRDGIIRRVEAGSFAVRDEAATQYQIGWMTPAEPAAFAGDGRRAIAIDYQRPNEAVCMELDGSERRTELRGHKLPIRFVTLSDDGTRAATASSGGPARPSEVMVWDAATGRLAHERVKGNEVTTRIALDPPGKHLALAGLARTTADNNSQGAGRPFVALIDIETGAESWRHDVPDVQVLALRFSTDGRRLAAAGLDRNVLIWDVESSRVVARSRQGPEGAMDLDFSPDGQRLAIASRQQVTLVNALSAEAVLILRGQAQLTPNQRGFNPRARFSPDGLTLFAVCDDRGESLAEWSVAGEGPDRRQWRVRSARRRAVNQHLGLARAHSWKSRDALANYHLDRACEYGLHSSAEHLRFAEICFNVRRFDDADHELNRAVALAPGDDAIVTAAGLVCAEAGQFRSASRWFARMKSLPPILWGAWWYRYPPLLLLAGDQVHYRALCDLLWRQIGSSPEPGEQATLAYACALQPGRASEAPSVLGLARQACAARPKSKEPGTGAFELLALGAAQVRAGEYGCAEASIQAAFTKAADAPTRALASSWLAIALAHQRRRAEAESAFAHADRFVRTQLAGEHPELDHTAPYTMPNPWDWWRLLLAWREAQALVMDGAFPSRPFAR